MPARKDMTYGDGQFLRELGIDPCLLDDPFPRPLPPPLPPESLIPSLTEKDACWILNLGITWEHEPELGFVPPKSLREYLVRYPNCIREATERAAKELEADLPNYYDLDDLAQDIVVMFLEFSEDDLEDIVEMYPLHPPMRPGGSRSAQFHDYIRHRVRAALRTLLKDRAPRPGDFRYPHGP
jgi:hypothetical protein